jgi:hypothetical protein
MGALLSCTALLTLLALLTSDLLCSSSEELADTGGESVSSASCVALASCEAGGQVGLSWLRNRGWVSSGDGVHRVGMCSLLLSLTTIVASLSSLASRAWGCSAYFSSVRCQKKRDKVHSPD